MFPSSATPNIWFIMISMHICFQMFWKIPTEVLSGPKHLLWYWQCFAGGFFIMYEINASWHHGWCAAFVFVFLFIFVFVYFCICICIKKWMFDKQMFYDIGNVLLAPCWLCIREYYEINASWLCAAFCKGNALWSMDGMDQNIFIYFYWYSSWWPNLFQCICIWYCDLWWKKGQGGE